MSNTMMGFDISLRNTGWVAAIVRGQGEYEIIDYGFIHTDPQQKKRGIRAADSNIERCKTIYRTLRAAIRQHHAQGLAFEVPNQGGQSAISIKAMAMATALIACLDEEHGLSFGTSGIFITPNENKVALTGKRNASKDAMMEAVRALFPEIEWPPATGKFEHIADAAGALYAVRYSDLYRRISGCGVGQ